MTAAEKEKALYGKRTKILSKDEDCTVYRIAERDGDVIMTSYWVFDVIRLIYNDIHAQTCSIEECNVGHSALVEKFQKVFDAIANTKPLFNSMFYNLVGEKDGIKQRKAWVCQVDEAYALCGFMAAKTAEYLLNHSHSSGVLWACELLQPEEIIDKLKKEKLIRDFKLLNFPLEEENEESETGEF